ncbi:putative receptor-like protein kinase [Platanthera zijinensis]|uniref:Receptor-like protein kinase n=1 Tax=Platanthera zijinensis TaxID=2320716 RepID=A0AAP0AY51_9ASPA
MGWGAQHIYVVCATYFCLVVVCFIFIGFTRGADGHRYYCDPSSCGDLQIGYPFRLKGDPANCGDPNYELTCNRGDNRTFMELAFIQFLVKEIDYYNKVIHVIDVALLSSNCSLPLKFLPSNSIDLLYYRFGAYDYHIRTYFRLLNYNWVSIMKCSKKLASKGYQLFPCQTTNDSYMYGVVGKTVANLAPSCSFLSWMPVIYDPFTSKDMFLALQEGFFLSWEKQDFSSSVAMIIRDCLGQSSWAFHENFKAIKLVTFISAVLMAEANFVGCISMERTMGPYIGGLMWEGCSFTVTDCAALCRYVFAPLSLCIFLAHKFWSNWAKEDAVEKFLRIQQSLSPTRYAFTDIIAITRNFRERLGSGGFGAVYKGELPGNHFIAVKLLAENSKLKGDDFISEVSTIGRIHHRNVVRLVGFCSDGSKRALIYEYMPNGSLEKYIFSSDKTPNHYFSWKKLNSIALGVARGINYLHRGCDMTILHFDIKPQNILLDHGFRPKISDFGLAKVYPKDQNVVSFNHARGTIGYIAPELASRSFGLISHKSDVYSFGMLLLEMVAGRRNVDGNARLSQVYYPSWVYDRLNNSINAMEEGIGIECGPEMNEVEKKLYIVGFCCVQMKSSDRPSMSDVMEMLEGDGDALQLPPKPFFSSSPSISKELNFEITGTKELTVIDEDDSSFDEDDSSVNEDGSG